MDLSVFEETGRHSAFENIRPLLTRTFKSNKSTLENMGQLRPIPQIWENLRARSEGPRGRGSHTEQPANLARRSATEILSKCGTGVKNWGEREHVRLLLPDSVIHSFRKGLTITKSCAWEIIPRMSGIGTYDTGLASLSVDTMGSSESS